MMTLYVSSKSIFSYSKRSKSSRSSAFISAMFLLGQQIADFSFVNIRIRKVVNKKITPKKNKKAEIENN